MGSGCALADVVHRVRMPRYEICASIVLLGNEDIAGGLVGICYAVRGGGDGVEQVTVV